MIGGARCVAGLDVGSTKTAAVILTATGSWDSEVGPPQVLGAGLAPTDGVRNQVVTNIEAATESVRRAIRDAEEMAGTEIRNVYANLAGTHVEIMGSAGVVAVAESEVTHLDVERVHDVARAIAVPPDRELIHAVPLDYALDGRRGVQDPVGMAATRLESEVCVVTADGAVCRNLRKSLDRAGVITEELVLNPLATCQAVLEDVERTAGVVLVEIGGGSTEVVVFKEDSIRLLASLPWGGEAVSNDIVKGLGVSRATAETLKKRHGAARTALINGSEKLDIPGPTPGQTREVSREMLAHIIEQRLDEILGLIYEELSDRSLLGELPAGVVLTGGGSMVEGTLDLAQDVFNMPVRLGAPGARLAGSVEAVRSPRYATAAGLALYGQRRVRERGPGIAGRLTGRVTDWLRDFF